MSDKRTSNSKAEAVDSALPGVTIESGRPATVSSHDGTAIRLNSFCLAAGGRTLLRNATAEFPAGRLTLLLGCSGVGKSLLMRILAGLIDESHPAVRFSGSIQFADGSDIDQRRNHQDHPVAIVFQSFALFDELSPSENIEIAVDHSPASTTVTSTSTVTSTATNKPQTSRKCAQELLKQLGVPADRPTSVLSGGQQQRLAIARAISMQTDVVLYDEPTSGLDTNTARQVARLIQKTQQDFRRTSVIVTHDFAALLEIADHVIVLDHRQQCLHEISSDRWNQLPEILGPPPVVDDGPAPESRLLRRAGERVLRAAEASGEFLEQVVTLPISLLPLWRSFRWGRRMTWHYMKLVAGWSACFYIAIAGMIIGFVAQDFIFRYLPFRQYTEPLLIENLLHATGFSLYRFLVPILCTILIAARSGAAVAADVGSKVYGDQLDAMKTIGMNPGRSVRTPILYAFLVGTPLLTFLSYSVAGLTSAVAFLMTHPAEGIAFWDSHFHKELRLPDSVFYKGTGWLVAKLLTCAAGIAMISWNCGSEPKQSAPDISHGVTRTILWSTLFVLIVHFVFSFFEFKAQI
ncbi:MAG: ABC transporter permease [Planctomycetaceae bacterium]|nr:ABC transporter permease [Planctomycetaceae bacterium]